jgi:hypothetical protein
MLLASNSSRQDDRVNEIRGLYSQFTVVKQLVSSPLSSLYIDTGESGKEWGGIIQYNTDF